MSDRDPALLLAWMRTRPGDVSIRDIGDTGPRAFRRRADADPALAALIASGEIVEASRRPLVYRVVPSSSAATLKAALPTRAEILRKLEAGIADLSDCPDGLATYWAAVQCRDELTALLRAAGKLPTTCPTCAVAGRLADDAVVSAFGCAMT